MTATANNLVRSPVETAQAALTLHELSDGRFNLGLGAGWQRDELEASGIDYPPPRQRAERYVAAIQIVRDLFSTGRARATAATTTSTSTCHDRPAGRRS